MTANTWLRSLKTAADSTSTGRRDRWCRLRRRDRRSGRPRLEWLEDRTLLAAPAVTTLAATAIGSSTATLNGTVNPNGDATTVTFIYGTDSTLATGTTTTTAQAIGGGTSPVAVTAPLTGLTPGTTYYFGVVATNGGGTADGTILSFTTAARPPARRHDAGGHGRHEHHGHAQRERQPGRGARPPSRSSTAPTRP